jgi:hypothetical protein
MSQNFLKMLLVLSGCLIGSAVAIMLTAKSQPKINPCEYQMIVTDDSVTVYDYDRTVGTIKLEGQLDSLINLDNQ